MRWALSILLLSCATALQLFAQPLGIGYYDLGSLYDTIPSPFYDDSAFTPTGANCWGTQRYTKHISRISALIDSLSLDVIGLCGVENDAVVRDIVHQCSGGYSYIYRTSNTFAGLDFALLYLPDRVQVERVASERNLLLTTLSTSATDSLTIILSRNGDDLLSYLSAEPPHPESRSVIMGKISQRALRVLSQRGAVDNTQIVGRGNYCSSSRGWYLREVIATRNIPHRSCAEVFIAPWLLDAESLQPLPLFENGDYIGGYSLSLPLFFYLNQE